MEASGPFAYNVREEKKMPATIETKRAIEHVVRVVEPTLDERQRRIFLAACAESLGHGGDAFVRSLTGVSPNTLAAGSAEAASSPGRSERVRAEGGGRKPKAESVPGLDEAIEAMVRGETYGDPERPLLWTTLSLRKIADGLLRGYGISVSHVLVGRRLEELGYSRQQNQKNEQVGEPHPDRDGQFRFINAKAEEFIASGDPVISVDTKKKELVGNFKNGGSEYRGRGDARRVLDHDFALPELGRVAPYGVYCVNDNTGFVNLGVSHDTSEFAAESVIRWWQAVGKGSFPDARRIYVNADGGGSNKARGFCWKWELQRVADETGLEIHMSHFPPGTSKWNKVEHRLFCYISKSWQGRPLVDIETCVELISATTTKTGLKVRCEVDRRTYDLGVKPTEEQIASIDIEECERYGKWNYIIRPRKK